jgi:hypothetical protein
MFTWIGILLGDLILVLGLTSYPHMVDRLLTSATFRKKYFSSVERLRIAQESAAQKRRRHPPSGAEPWSTSRASMDQVSSTSGLLHHTSCSSFFSLQTRESSFDARRHADALDETTQALRFLALPEKVKRSHLSIDELHALADKCERALALPAATKLVDEKSQRVSSSSDRRTGSLMSMSYGRSSRSEDSTYDIEKDGLALVFENVSSHHDDIPSSDILSETTAVEFDDDDDDEDDEMYKLYPHKRQGSVSSVYSALPTVSSPKEANFRPSSSRRSFSRKQVMSLAPLPLPPPCLTPAMPPLPSPNTMRTLQTVGVRLGESPPSTTTLVESPPPTTKYYKDVRARQKLRDYLSSPEGFDEALEFGFPKERPEPEWPITVSDASRDSSSDEELVPRSKEDQDNDNSGLEDDTGDDTDTATDSLHSPRTPSLFLDQFENTSSSHDSGIALSCNSAHHTSSGSITKGPYRPTIRSLSPDIDGRQMTLRMTLTRADLRAPEEELYGSALSTPTTTSKLHRARNFVLVPQSQTHHQRQASTSTASRNVSISSDASRLNSDPLALEALPVCDDHSGAQGAFAIPYHHHPQHSNHPSMPPRHLRSCSSETGFRKVWKSMRGRA